MIAAVSMVKDEAPMIGATVRHMLSQGIEHVWIVDWFSTDGTRELLSEFDEVTLLDADESVYYGSHQPRHINRAADLAGASGAEWIVPFDADEWWTGTHDRTIAEALSMVTADRVQATILQYVDFDHRELRQYPWQKVAYRYAPGRRVVAGNHYIEGGEGPADEDALLVHEMKFRSFEHFVQKCTRKIPWNEARDENQFGLAIGGDHCVYASYSIEQMNLEWQWLHEEIEDCSIPSEFRPL
jgi:glycosyltransferase involved in cell wall biosynthesis